jgi:hypothetical protein
MIEKEKQLENHLLDHSHSFSYTVYIELSVIMNKSID